jgi:hypothetical protein
MAASSETSKPAPQKIATTLSSSMSTSRPVVRESIFATLFIYWPFTRSPDSSTSWSSTNVKWFSVAWPRGTNLLDRHSSLRGWLGAVVDDIQKVVVDALCGRTEGCEMWSNRFA